jgi:hypothetical protein
MQQVYGSIKRSCSSGLCHKRRKTYQEPDKQTSRLTGNAQQLPAEITEHILKFSAPQLCGFLKGKAYLMKPLKLQTRYSRKTDLKMNLYAQRKTENQGSAGAIANDKVVVCKETCSDWKSYTETCIPKSLKLDLIKAFYLVMQSLVKSITNLQAPLQYTSMRLRPMKRTAEDPTFEYPIIDCHRNGEIYYFAGDKTSLAFHPTGPNMYEILRISDRYEFAQPYQLSALRSSIFSLNNRAFEVEFSRDEPDDDSDSPEYKAHVNSESLAFVDFSFTAHPDANLGRHSSLRPSARAFSAGQDSTRKVG